MSLGYNNMSQTVYLLYAITARVQLQLTVFWNGYTGWEFNSWTEVLR